MKIQIVTEGIQETEQSLSAFQREILPEIQKEVILADQELENTLRIYPPPIPTSDYVRTYAYRDSIKITQQLEGDVITVMEESDDVQHWLRGDVDGGYLGAYMHRGRWTTLRDLVQAFIPVLFSRVQNRINQLIERMGLHG